MITVFFFYGLSFFSLGLITAVYPKHREASALARRLGLIAAFGFIHAADEWTDMFGLIYSKEPLGSLMVVISAASFFCLLWFGVSTLVDRGAPRISYGALIILPLAWLVIILLSGNRATTANVLSRYLIGVPGTFLTAAALWSTSGDRDAGHGVGFLRTSAIAFVVYGVASCVIVKEAPFFPASVVNEEVFRSLMGIPIQVVRAGTAIATTLCMAGTLHVFDVDVRDQLQAKVASRTRELLEANDSLQQEIEDRAQRDSDLQASEARYRDLFENAHDAIFIVDDNLNYVDVNKRGVELFGYARDEFLTMSIVDLLPESQVPRSQVEFERLKNRQAYERFIGQAKTRDGRLLDVEVSSSPIIEDDRVVGSRDVVRDVTDRARLEQQLIQAQKMEAVGQLAGGIAHDFNNILTAIMGYAELMELEVEKEGGNREWLQAIVGAANKAAGLTRSLLAFSRKQIMDMRPIHLNAVIHASGQLLVSSIGEDVELVTKAAGDDLTVVGDENQLVQVLLNLATNARDAMPSGGSLTISAHRFESETSFSVGESSLPAGVYAILAVADTGQGMNEETAQKIFEPFYTTKEAGRGTGLGLSTAYGVVKQHSGAIRVESQSGQGTLMEIYLPLHDGSLDGKNTDEKASRSSGGSETVLLAEDDNAVRDLMTRVLSQAGYRVIAAADGREAVDQFTRFAEEIDLAILDVVMARMNGQQVYDEICRIEKDTKAVFVTGYARDILREKGLAEGGPRIVNKPVSPDQLLAVVREILDHD